MARTVSPPRFAVLRIASSRVDPSDGNKVPRKGRGPDRVRCWWTILDPPEAPRMSDIGPFKFTRDVTSSAFSKTLAARVDHYFRQRGLSRHANAEMISKTMLAFAMWM